MAARKRTSGGIICRAHNCSVGYYNQYDGEKISLFTFPKDKARWDIFHDIIMSCYSVNKSPTCPVDRFHVSGTFSYCKYNVHVCVVWLGCRWYNTWCPVTSLLFLMLHPFTYCMTVLNIYKGFIDFFSTHTCNWKRNSVCIFNTLLSTWIGYRVTRGHHFKNYYDSSKIFIDIGVKNGWTTPK